MLFSSIIFIFYFLPSVLVLYYALSFCRNAQNILLFFASLFFYAWGEPKFVLLMCIGIMINYVIGLGIGCVDRLQKEGIKKALLLLAIFYNISVLVSFKYLSFILEIVNQGLPVAKQFAIMETALPIGISFYTFQALSYVIDVYRKKTMPQKNPFSLGLYIAFFPQLVAGPIVRYETIQEQIMFRKESVEKFAIGSCRFMIGLAKKVLIANSMAVVADQIFSMQQTGSISISLAWLGAIAYALQIYYDFSAYSDMAIGLSLFFGFRFDENFMYPYISKSISEFWRRWHISLGNWFKEYVYFPLGGSRVKNKDIMVRNLLVVWILTGIWHGAEWTFLFWGVYQFIFIFLEKLFDWEQTAIRPWIKQTCCIIVVILGWVLFRSEDIVQAGTYYRAMFGIGNAGGVCDYTMMFLREYGIFFLIAIVFSFPIAPRINEYQHKKKRGYRVIEFGYPIVMMGLLFLSLSYLVKGTYNPFIYFNF